MNTKKLNEMINGDFGEVTIIRGKAGIHRQLLKLGIKAGGVIHVISRKMDKEASMLTVVVNNHIRSLSCDVAAGIKIDVIS